MSKIKLHTSRFGEIEIEQSKLLQFDQGLIRFAELRQFTVIEFKQPFSWLQSIEDPSLAFVVVDSSRLNVDSNYYPELKDLIGLSPQDDFVCLYLVVVTQSLPDATINLLAPLYINLQNNCGCQLILEQENRSAKAGLWELLKP